MDFHVWDETKYQGAVHTAWVLSRGSRTRGARISLEACRKRMESTQKAYGNDEESMQKADGKHAECIQKAYRKLTESMEKAYSKRMNSMQKAYRKLWKG